jgi:ribosomal protein S18 acetylase RimI-like enzyme
VAETNVLRIEFRQIAPGDKLTGLSLGSSEFTSLKTYLRRDAALHHNHDLAKTYAAFLTGDQPKLVGYITLVCGQIESERAQAELGPNVQYRYDHYPAIKIARLAVDHRYGGRGIGRDLVRLALGIILDEICPRVGCRFVVVDAKQSAVRFYDRTCGFTLLDTPENRASERPVMFLDLHKAAALAG